MNLRTKKVIFAMAFAGVAMSNVVTSFAAMSTKTVKSEDAQYEVSADVDYFEMPFSKDHVIYYIGMRGADVRNGAATVDYKVYCRYYVGSNKKFLTIKGGELSDTCVSVSGRKKGLTNKKYDRASISFVVDGDEYYVSEYNDEYKN